MLSDSQAFPSSVRYLLTGPRISVAGAVQCSRNSRRGISHLAGGVLALGLAVLAGCGKDSGSNGLGPEPTASLSVAISGLPNGSLASVELTGPNGYAKHLVRTDTAAGLRAGTYTLTAENVATALDGYRPATLTQSITIAGGSAENAAVVYQISTGRLGLTVLGIPDGTARITVTGPDHVDHAVIGTTVLTNLTPGSHLIRTDVVMLDGDQFASGVDSVTVLVAAGLAPAAATVQYGPITGHLDLIVGEVPSGTTAGVTVTGPGFTGSYATSTLIKGLVPGAYTVSSGDLTSGGHLYRALVAEPNVTVGLAAASIDSVTYQLSTGALDVTVDGLPSGAAAAVSVSGPDGYFTTVATTSTLVGLTPGSYTIVASNVIASGTTYAANLLTQVVWVAATLQPTAALVHYAVGLGGLTVTVTGLPAGANAVVEVTGPAAYHHSLTGSSQLNGLTPGNYTVGASTVVWLGATYVPTPASQVASVPNAGSAVATISYAVTTGTLAVSVTGLPGGAAAAVTVTGPGSFTRSVTGPATFTGVAPGSYTVSATNVASGGNSYAPAPAGQVVSVAAGATATAVVAYSVVISPTLDFTIAGMYLTQATQRFDGSVPLVAGRDGYLRVFVTANQANTAAPAVRVRLYSGSTLVQTSTISAPSASVPLAVNEGSLTSSWNLLIPGASIGPNLKILADVDPTDATPEASEANNTFPVSGSPFAVDVRALATFQLRFVPVLQQVNSLQGDVTGANQAQYLTELLKMLPVGDYNVDIRAVYTTTAAALQSGNGNGAWGTVLSEILALKSADASSRYYYGVVKASYMSGVAGMGYIGSGANAAIGWDWLPSGAGVMAHELGHNMGRMHAPCGGVSGPDPSYPYAGGGIGVYGLDVASLTLKAPGSYLDLMGYCNPDWVSDYNWTAMVGYRGSSPNYAPTAGPAKAGLLIFGRVVDGTVILEPAIRVDAPIAPAPTSGRYRVVGLASDGSTVLSATVDPIEVATEGQGSEQHFATVIPLAAGAEQALAELRVTTPAGTVSRRSAQAMALPQGRLIQWRDPRSSWTRVSAARARLTWDSDDYPMAVVRDPATGQILSFARGGAATLWTNQAEVDVVFSDGVRSFTRRIK